ncbi:hypothetical protein GCM10027416_21140 [Okibacterium endophyticum]
MRKRNKIIAAGALAVALAFGSSTAAFAASYGAKSCGGITHAFVEGTTKGVPTLKITGTNGSYNETRFQRSTSWQRNYLNSPTQSSKSASVTGYTSLQSGGVGCSI